MISSKNLIFSILAGLISALFAALALTRPGLLTVMIYFASVPIFYAGLARGSLSGIIAAIVAAVSTGVAGGLAIGIIVTMTLAGPAAYGAYLAGLSRHHDDGTVVWFPLSEILFRLALAIAAAYIAVGLWFGYEVTVVAAEFEKFMLEVLASQNAVLGEEQEASVRSNSILYASLLPLVVPAFSLAIMIWNMGIAERLVRRRSGLQRPKDNIAADSGLPRMALLLFAAAVIAALVLPPVQNLALVIIGTMGMAIAMIGLAVLHYFTWGIRVRSQILFITYVVLITLSLPILLFLAVGLVELIYLLRARDPDRMTRTLNPPKKSQ